MTKRGPLSRSPSFSPVRLFTVRVSDLLREAETAGSEDPVYDALVAIQKELHPRNDLGRLLRVPLASCERCGLLVLTDDLPNNICVDCREDTLVEACSCLCHEDPAHSHTIACCGTCQSCGMRVRIDKAAFHGGTCGTRKIH